MFIDKPNWQKIVSDLLKSRKQKDLQELTGVPQSTISALKTGKNKERLSFENGRALLNAWHNNLKSEVTP